MQVREEQRLDVDVEVTRIGAVFGGELHQAGTGVPVRRVAAAGNQLHAAHAVEQTEVGDVLQGVLQVGRGRGVVDALELIGRLKGKTAANRDRPRLVDRDAGNAAKQRVLVGVEALALHHVDLRTRHRVGVDRHAALKSAAGRARCVEAITLSVRESGTLTACCEPLSTTTAIEYAAYPLLANDSEYVSGKTLKKRYAPLASVVVRYVALGTSRPPPRPTPRRGFCRR